MKLRLCDLGSMDYGRCWELQRQLFDALVAAKTPARTPSAPHEAGKRALRTEQAPATAPECNPAASGGPAEEAGTLLMVEHPPVYTLGKSGHAENLLIGRETLERLGARFYHIDRGGDITFHGPGQLVVYPILDLERLGIGLREYIAALEECVIRCAAHYGLRTGRIAGASGVWLGAGTDYGPAATTDAAARCLGTAADGPTRKLCAIGVRSSRYITMHGFALNVATDLVWFERINPCGFRDRGATSLERETGRTIAMEEVKSLVAKNLSEILNVEIYK